MTEHMDVVIVGSGPNGLSAGVILARAGLNVRILESQAEPGGGARTFSSEVFPGIRYDTCSAVHPLALASPFFRAFNLASRGVEMIVPEASYAQPLDKEPAAVAWHDLEVMEDELGLDGRAWRKMFRSLVEGNETIVDIALGDMRSIPQSAQNLTGITSAAKFGLRIGQTGTRAWDLPLRTERARALLTGVAAHASGRLPSLSSAGTALFLASLGHVHGWPIPRGGSAAITSSLISDFTDHGGEIETEVHISHISEIPPARVVLLDTSAIGAARILKGRVREDSLAMLKKFPHGGAAAKVDFVLSGPIPWRDSNVNRAGTQHLGGTREQMAAAEIEASRGRTPEFPVVLVSDPGEFDSSRIIDGFRPIWAYAHVAYDDPRDPSDLVISQIERFAPGFRDLILHSRGIPASQMINHNPSLVGGDIGLGKISMWNMISRPSLKADPYHLADGVYLCSSATPPGPGVHGMAGWHAARRILRREFGLRASLECSTGSDVGIFSA